MPEAVGRRAAHALLEEISRGGVVDSEHQARPQHRPTFLVLSAMLRVHVILPPCIHHN